MAEPFENPLPQNIEYEKCVLGAMLVNPKKCREVLNFLKPDDFYDSRHKLIFQACVKLDKQNKPIELPTVHTFLRERGQDDRVPPSYVSGLMVEDLIPSSVQAYIEDIRNKSVLRAGIKTANAIIKTCFKSGADGKTIPGQIQDGLRNIEKGLLTGELALDDPHKPLIEVLMDKHEQDYNRDPKELLGHRLQKFKTLANNIDGVQPGFYVIGAETNVGKTAFLCNLALDLLDSNSDLTGIYFSLDDNKDVILNRVLSIKTGIPLNQVQRPQKNDKHIRMLDDGYTYLFKLAEDKRLSVRDSTEISDVADLELEIKRRMNRPLFVVIDGLYNLDVGGTGADMRKENIERANKLKTLADVYRIPVICTGELRKKERSAGADRAPSIDDLMETGKFAYNANLVLLIYPETWEDYNTNDEPILNLKYAKNKLSHVRTTGKIKFIRKTSQIEEWESPSKSFSKDKKD
jgi:replicative DNA helicase